MDTSSAKQDKVDIGRDGADEVGGTEPRPRGFPPLTTAERASGREGWEYKKRQTDMVCPFYVDSQRLTTLLLEPLQQLPEPLLQPQP